MSISHTDSSDNSSNNGEKYCTVCDKPNARNNFGALSCNACAAFFRRTLVQGRQYSCHCGCSNHDILCMEMDHQRNMRGCKFCRFQKCLHSGMQKKAIRSMDVWKWRNDMKRIEGRTKKSKVKRKLLVTTEIDESANMQLELLPFAPIMKENLFEAGLLPDLIFAEQSFFRIHNSRNRLTDDVIRKIGQMNWNAIVETQDNLLGKADQFSLEPQEVCYGQEMLGKQKQLDENQALVDLFNMEPYIRDILCSIGFAKTLPFFRKLNLQDQCILLSTQTLPQIGLYLCFYSMQRGFKVLSEPNGLPLIESYKCTPHYRSDPVAWNLAKRVNCDAIVPMLTVRPSREEFAFLLALIFTNPAIAGLSAEGQKLLREESERYSRCLLQLQQREYGDAKGALRYADTLRLIANSILNAQKHRELVVYLDSGASKLWFQNH